MGATPTYDLPYPEASDPPNGPAQLKALAEAVEAELENVYAVDPWVDVTSFAGGWTVPVGTWPPVQYRRLPHGRVAMRGRLGGGTVSGSTVVFTIGAGFRPLYNIPLATSGGTTNGGGSSIIVNANGNVLLNDADSGGFVSLNCAWDIV